jgi:hypothetical protein
MSSSNDLTPLLKRLKLGAVLNTLPELEESNWTMPPSYRSSWLTR